MATQKQYYAYLTNNTGASCDVPMKTTNKNKLKSYIRDNYSGFRVHIMAKIDGHSEEVETFKLRGA